MEGLRIREAQARRGGERDDEDKPSVREAKGEKASAYVGRGDAGAGEEEIEEGSYSARVEPEPEAKPETEAPAETEEKQE